MDEREREGTRDWVIGGRASVKITCGKEERSKARIAEPTKTHLILTLI